MSYTIGTAPPPPACRMYPETSRWCAPLQKLATGEGTFIDLGPAASDQERTKVRRHVRQAATAMGMEIRIYTDARGHTIVTPATADAPEDDEPIL